MPRAELGVWLYGRKVAVLSRGGVARLNCDYTEEALGTWPGNLALLSCSLPLRARRYQANRFFRGLLPEGQHLQAVADRAGLATNDTFGLLERYGRDVAGALVIATDDPGPRFGTTHRYSDRELNTEIEELDERPLGIHDDSELSLAGLQNKLLLVRADGGWARPIGGRASTHILKVEDPRYPGLVRLEAACLHLAKALGLTTVEAHLERHGDLDCLIVSRYDRVVTADGVERVHQEDACQALGKDPDANGRRGKYESSGGPSLREVAGLLDTYADDAGNELRRLAAATTFTVLIGNADAHGKNLSFVHRRPGVIELAPLYDTVPTVNWDRLPDRAAMHINGVHRLSDVTLDDLVEEVASWPVSTKVAREVVTGTLDRAVATVAGTGVDDTVAGIVTRRAVALGR